MTAHAIPAEAPATTPRPLGRAAALVDILVFLGASLLLFGTEELFRRAGWFPMAGLFSGGPTLIGSFFVVVAIMKWRGQSWPDLGLRRPASGWTIPLWALVVIAVNVVAQLTIVPVLAALLGAPAPDLSRYDPIRGNFSLFLVCALGTMFTGGFVEEFIYRGMMVDRLARILGAKRLWPAAILCGVPFGLVHFAWGIGGILVTTVMGSVLGLLYLATGRNLWPLVVGHATLDALLMFQAYQGMLE